MKRPYKPNPIQINIENQKSKISILQDFLPYQGRCPKKGRILQMDRDQYSHGQNKGQTDKYQPGFLV